MCVRACVCVCVCVVTSIFPSLYDLGLCPAADYMTIAPRLWRLLRGYDGLYETLSVGMLLSNIPLLFLLNISSGLKNYISYIDRC